MLNLNLTLKRIAAALIGAAILTTSVTSVSHANPPRWAQAHGHHGKRHHHPRPKVVYVERHEHVYRDRDYAPTDGINAQQGGTILGAILGAIAGTQVGKGKGRAVAILGGAVLGGVFGNEIGRSIQQSDEARVQHALETNRTGQSVSWQNPDTGSTYKVTPTNTYKTNANQDCRDFTTWAVIDGYEEEVQGTACRQPDGTWKQLKI